MLISKYSLTSSYSGQSKASRFLLPQKVAPLLPAADEGVMCSRKIMSFVLRSERLLKAGSDMGFRVTWERVLAQSQVYLAA